MQALERMSEKTSFHAVVELIMIGSPNVAACHVTIRCHQMGLICSVSIISVLCVLHISYLEMKRDEREDQSLQILYQVVEDSQSLGVLRLGHIDQ